MEINQIQMKQVALPKNDDSNDEAIVRRALIEVWTATLESYARSGAIIPPVDEARQRLADQGFDAAMSALSKHRWYVPAVFFRERVRSEIDNGLGQIDLAAFLDKVRYAQHHPEVLPELRAEIERHISSF